LKDKNTGFKGRKYREDGGKKKKKKEKKDEKRGHHDLKMKHGSRAKKKKKKRPKQPGKSELWADSQFFFSKKSYKMTFFLSFG
jgi:hypothetical protein